MSKKVRLSAVAFARSGDKGDISNIGLMAKTPENYAIIKKHVTPEAIKAHFKHWVKGKVVVAEVPYMNALEILMYEALGGGATKTLRIDQTGKSMGNGLLWMEIELSDEELAIANLV